ncbi:ankyrin repeat-containing domain protein [Calycina marina]|uniref:Ankyrin repeat-containing domain protein n=1 Tax=Calycina marina TaxID=1763456 RepID=A0A9P7YUF0_9HELO|nr:ankyrin repeat-containing domain protein [Calycina marina]
MQNDFVGAVSSGNEQAVEELLLQGADPDLPENPTPLWLAAIGKHAAIVKILLKTRRVNVEAENKSNHGERAIHEPCIWGGRDEIQIVEALLDAHANIEGTTIGAWTPLHQAARFHGSEELMRFLIQRGADVEAVIGRCLSTPLHLAAEVGNIGKIKVLLKAGARPDIEDVDGRTPKVRAEENNHAEAANLL